MGTSTEDILAKYGKKIESRLRTNSSNSEEFSKDYTNFRAEMIPELGRYERWAHSLGNLIKINVSVKDRAKVEKNLSDARLDVTASQALTLSLVSLILIFFVTILSAMIYSLIAFPGGLASMTSNQTSNLVLFVFLGLTAALFVFYYIYTMPKRLANSWRLRASAQMVPAVLYMVVYMKHTSNLEKAVEFASLHLEGPLAVDFKKIFYDVEIGKYSTIKQALDDYLESWRDYAPEFIESVHLVESSLFEPSEARRVEILEKGLQIILDGVYEKMLKYSREIRSPLTNLYMLGIILPTLGLAMLPLASILLGGLITWPHVMIFFNVLVPFFVYYMVGEVLLKRPGGYGETSTLELNPGYVKYKSKKPWIVAGVVAFVFLLIGLSPFIFQVKFITDSLGLSSDYSLDFVGLPGVSFFDFKLIGTNRIGPFGPGAVLLSLFLPLALMVFFSLGYAGNTKSLIKTRDDTKVLEKEFSNSLFQLGNRLGGGTPAEIAFGQIASSTQGQKSATFFSLVSQNVRQRGMSLDRAIFDVRNGALIYFPSALISTSMRILTESVQKGLKIAARALMAISEYVKNIDRINQRLNDLLSEIVSDMKSNMVFLAPLLAGIVVGLSGMITFILNKLTLIQSAGTDLAGLGSFATITTIFDLNQMIPSYFLQISVGIYIIEIVFILTGALVTVDSGKDPLREKYDLSRNLRRGVLLYLITAFISLVTLIVLASVSLGSLG